MTPIDSLFVDLFDGGHNNGMVLIILHFVGLEV